jgi:putative ABC transport system permease protein
MKDIQPSKFAVWLLKKFCKEEYLEVFLGDLEEMFYERAQKMSSRKARWLHLLGVLSLFRPFALKKVRLLTYFSNQSIMLRNHFKIALRSLKKNTFYTAINIFGLALGLAAFFLVFIFTQFESSFDQHHPHADRLFRVNQTNIWAPEGGSMSSTPPPLAAALLKDYPEVEDVTRINTPGSRLVRHTTEYGKLLAFNEEDVLAADSNFFEFFAFPLIEGDPQTALVGPNKVVLSQETAQKYFGYQDALGKVLEFGDERIPVEVSGVALEAPDNSHFDFDFLLSMPSNPNVERMDWSWIWTQMVTYARLKSPDAKDALEGKLTALSDQYVVPSLSRLGMSFDDFIKTKGGWNFYLQNVQTIHLHSQDIGNRIGPIGNMAIVQLMKVVALFILLIAILNFVNLSTARASTRAKEIGVKKTLGAMRTDLIQQFLVESITIATVASFMAVGIVPVLGWSIHYLTGIDIPFEQYWQPELFLWFIPIPFIVGILAGFYPALYLSAFRPIKVLKGRLAGGMKKSRLRNLLVTTQFTISIALMAGTILVYQQLKYIENKNLGFEHENILVINHANKLGHQIESFRNEVQAFTEVSEAALAMDMPGRGTWEDFYTTEGTNTRLSISQNKIDEFYFPAMGFSLVAGRTFEEGRGEDQSGLIINETTARLFQWTNEEAIGQKIIYPDYPGDLKVIGVVEDYHLQSLRQEIMPMMFFHMDTDVWGDQRVVAVKYQGENEDQLLSKLEQSWNRMTDDVPFDYSFYTEEIEQLYAQERSLSGLFSIFTGFSLFIAIIGLIGLLSFATEQRKKEIGIRKVLGASKLQIFSLLNKQYMGLFLLALILAIPLSWQQMQNWLNAYAYRVDVSVFVYLIAGIIVITLSLVSVSYLSLRIAATNPVEVLKDE